MFFIHSLRHYVLCILLSASCNSAYCQSVMKVALLSPDIQKKIENFKNKDINNSQILVDDASAELSNIFISAASISLKWGTKSKKSAKDKKWHEIRSEVT